MDRFSSLITEPRAQIYAGLIGAASVSLARHLATPGPWPRGIEELVIIAFVLVYALVIRQIAFPQYGEFIFFKSIFFVLLIVAGFSFGFRPQPQLPLLIGYGVYAMVVSYLLAGAGENILAVCQYIWEKKLPAELVFNQIRGIRDEIYHLGFKLCVMALIPISFTQFYLWWLGGGDGGIYLGPVGAILIWACFFLPVHHVQKSTALWATSWAAKVESHIQNEYRKGLETELDIVPINARLNFLRLLRSELEDLVDISLPPNLLWSVILLGLIPLVIAVIPALWPRW